MQDGLRKVKNDPDLRSSATNAGNYVVLNGITAVGSPESGDAPAVARREPCGRRRPGSSAARNSSASSWPACSGPMCFRRACLYPSVFPCRTEKIREKSRSGFK
jgi:hypothetical protein